MAILDAQTRNWLMWGRIYHMEATASGHSHKTAIAWANLRIAERMFSEDPTDDRRLMHLEAKRDEWACALRAAS